MIETISDAMTSVELDAACRAIQSQLGATASVHAIAGGGGYSSGETACLIIYHQNYKETEHFKAHSWPEVFAAAQSWVATHQAVRRNAIVRRMALAVIELTDEHGACTETLLRGKDFTAAEVVEFHEAACVRAGEMTGNAPFSVIFAVTDVAVETREAA